MSTYELDDELVRQFTAGNPGPRAWERITEELKNQLPLPAPYLAGAVVRVGQVVYGNVVWIRLSPEGSGRREFQWVGLNDPDTSISTEKLGRIVEVLSEGVDL